MLIQILFERRRCCNSFRIIPLFFIKLSLLVGYLTGTQIYEIKTNDGGWGWVPYSFRSRSTFYVRKNTLKYHYEYVNGACFFVIGISLCHERYCSWWIMRIKGFVHRLSHDCLIDIDRDVSTAYCRSSLGNSVDLLSRFYRNRKGAQ